MKKKSVLRGQKFSFLNIFQIFFRNELHAPFLPYFDTQHPMCIIIILFVEGSNGGPKTLKKKNTVLAVPKVLLEGASAKNVG